MRFWWLILIIRQLKPRMPPHSSTIYRSLYVDKEWNLSASKCVIVHKVTVCTGISFDAALDQMRSMPFMSLGIS
ncbi:hypothetical protein HYC85_021087 [Camellia sinensis]|uniref:Uncharacterized protein n=1 Tax=Camellia sinensis TaxID=4442 RepID=A0A7J7GGN0_CAMSI|nr:hypothetical protein HYC85_021087 [Camellia sinensis]